MDAICGEKDICMSSQKYMFIGSILLPIMLGEWRADLWNVVF